MNRRTFLTHSSAGAAYLGLGGLSLNSCKRFTKRHITILHTNDVHSHIDPFPKDHSQFANMGGLARRAKLVNRIRKENANTLLLDAGDIFQGTPYFNFYGGELEFKLMSMLKYDAATIGNHDFDNGVGGLLVQLPNAKFPLLSANYDFSNTILDGHVQPFSTNLLDEIKIGVFGLGIELDGLVNKDLYKETNYLNPIEIAQDTSRILRDDHQCDLIICLSHLGYEYEQQTQKPSDVVLASQTENIDLIIGGHTHTFLEKPIVMRNRVDKEVLINQVGCYGINLGRIDFYFDSEQQVKINGLSIRV